MVRSWTKNPGVAVGALTAVLGLAAFVALRSLSGVANAVPTDSVCADAGDGTIEYTVELTSSEGNDFDYTLTGEEFASTDCTGDGTAMSDEDVVESINGMLVQTCELGLHINSTAPESVYTDEDEDTGLAGWKFTAGDFSSVILHMDDEYEDTGETGFFLVTATSEEPLELEVDGPDCFAEESPTASTTASETTSATVSTTASVTTSATVSPSASVTASTTATTTTTPEESRTFELAYRWSLVGWLGEDGIDPMDALDGDGDELNDVSDIVTAVYGWNNEDQDWMGFFPSGVGVPGANDLETLEFGEAYFIAIDDEEGTEWVVESGP